jgi:archaemetzincin
MPEITIVPIRFSAIPLLVSLSELVTREMSWPSSIAQIDFDHSYTYDPNRKQYHSSQLLVGLKNLINPGDDKYLAVTDLDLFIPILTFVFGEAQLGGPMAIVSTYRLRPDFYGLPKDDNLVLQRLEKEAVHELGHTFGLRHCPDYQCVMTASTYVEEIDLKGVEFCKDCTASLRRNTVPV